MALDTETLEKTELKKPVPYNVVLVQTRPGASNASIEPTIIMSILKNVYGKDDSAARELTMELANSGKTIAHTYTREIANEKAEEGTTYLQKYAQDAKAVAEPASV